MQNPPPAMKQDPAAPAADFPSRPELRLLEKVGGLVRAVAGLPEVVEEDPLLGDPVRRRRGRGTEEADAAVAAKQRRKREGELRRRLRALADEAAELFRRRPQLTLARGTRAPWEREAKGPSRQELLAYLAAVELNLRGEGRYDSSTARLTFASLLQKRRAARLRAQIRQRESWSFPRLRSDITLEQDFARQLYSRERPKPAAQEKEPRPSGPGVAEVLRLLDKEVAGQREAKEVLALALWRQGLRAAGRGEGTPDIPIPLLIGPTGAGKTHLCRTLAKGLKRPFVSIAATAISSTGFVGESWADGLSRLLKAADGDRELCERSGIVFIDEIDKLRRRGVLANSGGQGGGADIKGEGPQQELLTILGGTQVHLAVKGGPSEAALDTGRGMLFILGGCFDGLEAIRAERLRGKPGLGFEAQNSGAGPSADMGYAAEDFEQYGFLRELVGRISGSVAELKPLELADLESILLSPMHGYLPQYAKLMRKRGSRLSWDAAAVRALALRSMRRGLGARGLKPDIEKFLRPLLLPEGRGKWLMTADGEQLLLSPDLPEGGQAAEGLAATAEPELRS